MRTNKLINKPRTEASCLKWMFEDIRSWCQTLHRNKLRSFSSVWVSHRAHYNDSRTVLIPLQWLLKLQCQISLLYFFNTKTLYILQRAFETYCQEDGFVDSLSLFSTQCLSFVCCAENEVVFQLAGCSETEKKQHKLSFINPYYNSFSQISWWDQTHTQTHHIAFSWSKGDFVFNVYILVFLLYRTKKIKACWFRWYQTWNYTCK